MKNKIAQELAKLRWINISKEDRTKHAKKMNKASLVVRRKLAKQRERVAK